MEKIKNALRDLKKGKMVILFDDIHRENEGDLVMAAEKITPDAINFMASHARGLICLSMQEDQLNRLQIPMMPHRQRKTAFATSIEAAKGVTTGISAFDRAHTIRVATDPRSKPDDIIMPGHVFPVRAVKGGVLKRPGHTEGSVDLAMLAGLKPAAVMCEIMNENGTMARMEDLKRFAKKHRLKLISIHDLIHYRKMTENLVKEVSSATLPVNSGARFKIKVFEAMMDSDYPIALIRGRIDPKKPLLVRIHSECFTGDVLGSIRCDCAWQLKTSLLQIEREGGVLLYLRQEGRGIGLVNKIKAYHLQDQGLDTVEANHRLGFEADQRDYAVAAQILRHLGVEEMRLMTNNPNKIKRLRSFGFKKIKRVPLVMTPVSENYQYLRVKRDKLGHLLNFKKRGNTRK